MSFRNRKALACAMAVMLAATCMMFVMPESSDASTSSGGTVVIESDMNDSMPISDIVLQYSAISAEKEHQESMGKDVIIRDNEPKKEDPKEQRFIDDMRHMIGSDKREQSLSNPDSNISFVKMEPVSAMEHHKDIICSIAVISPVPTSPMFGETQVIAEEPVITTEPETEVVTECEQDTCYEVSADPADETTECEIVTITGSSPLDIDFIRDAIMLAEKNGVELDERLEYLASFSSKIIIAVAYSEINSSDVSSKQDNEPEDETVVVIFTEDDEENDVPEIPDEPTVIQDLFSVPVATETVADTLCSGTDI